MTAYKKTPRGEGLHTTIYACRITTRKDTKKTCATYARQKEGSGECRQVPRQPKRPFIICIIEYIIHFVTLCDTLRRGPCGTTQSSESQHFAHFARQKRDSPHQKRPCSRGLAGIWRVDATWSVEVRNYANVREKYAKFTRKSPPACPRCVAGPLHRCCISNCCAVACVVQCHRRA